MMLMPWVALSSLGFAVFVLGAYLDYLGVAAVGAVLIIGLGASVAVDDLETTTGEEIERDYSVVELNQSGQNGSENVTVVTSVTKHQTTATVAPLRTFGETGPFALGGLQMLTGAVLFSRRLEEEI